MVKTKKVQWHGLLVWVWFVSLVGLTARLGDNVRLYATLRQQRQQGEVALQRVKRQVVILQNKLRYLHTPEGVGLVQRAQFWGTDKEQLLVLDGMLFPFSIIELLPGGFEEWQNADRHAQSLCEGWRKRLSRHWHRRHGDRWR